MTPAEIAEWKRDVHPDSMAAKLIAEVERLTRECLLQGRAENEDLIATLKDERDEARAEVERLAARVRELCASQPERVAGLECRAVSAERARDEARAEVERLRAELETANTTISVLRGAYCLDGAPCGLCPKCAKAAREESEKLRARVAGLTKCEGLRAALASGGQAMTRLEATGKLLAWFEHEEAPYHHANCECDACEAVDALTALHTPTPLGITRSMTKEERRIARERVSPPPRDESEAQPASCRKCGDNALGDGLCFECRHLEAQPRLATYSIPALPTDPEADRMADKFFAEAQPGIGKDKTTPENREFWEFVERTSAEVAAWPTWKGGDRPPPSDRGNAGPVSTPDKRPGSTPGGGQMTATYSIPALPAASPERDDEVARLLRREEPRTRLARPDAIEQPRTDARDERIARLEGALRTADRLCASLVCEPMPVDLYLDVRNAQDEIKAAMSGGEEGK